MSKERTEMKLLYLTTWDFSNEESDGVCKKIYSHINIFEKNGYQVDFIYLKNNKVMYRENNKTRELTKIGTIKKTPAYIKMYKHIKQMKYDWVYNRYGMMDTFYFKVLKRLKDNGSRILVEIPTYPYAGEIPKGLLYKMMLKWDEMYLNRLKDCIDVIATYSQHNEIWGIETIKVVNGIDVSKIGIKKQKKPTECVELIGVANVSKWHGFDRVIQGLKQYYKLGDVNKKVRFHIVGEGAVLQEYKDMVEENQLSEVVIFHGKKQGKELDAIYDQSDIAISSLGLHRIGIMTQASVLKSREYAAKGLPMISSIKIDIFPTETYKYIKYFSEDDEPININELLKWYEQLHTDNNDIRYLIRDYAVRKCDQAVVMQPVLQYMKEA